MRRFLLLILLLGVYAQIQAQSRKRNSPKKDRIVTSSYAQAIDSLNTFFNAGNIVEMERMLISSNDSVKAEVARNISRYYNDGFHVPRNFQKSFAYAQRSLQLSKNLNDRMRQINANNQLGYLYLCENNFGEAEIYFHQVINLGSKSLLDNVGFAFYQIIRLMQVKGHYNRATEYSLDALRYLEKRDADPYSNDIYNLLEHIYSFQGDYSSSLYFVDKAIEGALKDSNFEYYWNYVHNKSSTMLKMGKAREALVMLENALKRYPPQTPVPRIWAAFAKGSIYSKLGDYPTATAEFLRAHQLNSDSSIDELQQKAFATGIEKELASIYLTTDNLQSAQRCVEKLMSPAAYHTTPSLAASHLLAFRIDSAMGNFESALMHLQQHKGLTDSINALSRLRQIEELQLQYNTEKIVQENTLKQQRILLLENEQALRAKIYDEKQLRLQIENSNKENRLLLLAAETAEKDRNILLNRQNITQLQADNAARKARLEDATFSRNILFGFAFLLLLIAILLLRQYMVKQATARIISNKNEALQQLVEEKNGLLEEKDWLLKEVHHRVKNNLQTVVSLLESQSIYLDNQALEANMDSRNRVYAMSLVHQKLYQSESLASIQMDIYLAELVQHLRDSIGEAGIRFQTDLLPVRLDVSQAIPLGLILNEAVTNSIKHAFPADQGDRTIAVRLARQGPGLRLAISDNGSGFPPQLASGSPSSLGLKLMKGLTGDIAGSFSIDTAAGTNVFIDFVPAETLHGASPGIANPAADPLSSLPA